jgi:hypothetical protein
MQIDQISYNLRFNLGLKIANFICFYLVSCNLCRESVTVQFVFLLQILEHLTADPFHIVHHFLATSYQRKTLFTSPFLWIKWRQRKMHSCWRWRHNLWAPKLIVIAQLMKACALSSFMCVIYPPDTYFWHLLSWAA